MKQLILIGFILSITACTNTRPLQTTSTAIDPPPPNMVPYLPSETNVTTVVY